MTQISMQTQEQLNNHAINLGNKTSVMGSQIPFRMVLLPVQVGGHVAVVGGDALALPVATPFGVAFGGSRSRGGGREGGQQDPRQGPPERFWRTAHHLTIIRSGPAVVKTTLPTM